MKAFSAIAFILARKNSKRLPGKNKKLLNGKPLFQYSVEAAICSKCYDQVILSTDDEDIQEVGSRIQGLTVFKRSQEYAGDEVRAKDVVLYHLHEMKREFDYVSLLMTTSPFRTADDIRESFSLLTETGGDSLTSVVEYGFHPALALKKLNGRLYSYFEENKDFNWVRESEFEKAYHLNGAIFTAATKSFLKTGSFIHNGTVPYIMNKIRSVDIDNELDFKFAEFLIKEGSL